MRKTAFALITLTLALNLHGDVQCTATTPINNQARTQVKHRAPAAMTVSAQPISVGTMIAWAVPAHVSDPAVRRSNTPIAARENSVYTLTGDLWRVKVEGNDCDFHMEVSAENATATSPRVIVEVPQEQTALRDQIIQAVHDAGLGDLTSSSNLNFTTPLTIEATGYAFYDATHWTSTNPKKGHGHGTQYVQTLWELHPVFAVTFPSLAPSVAPLVATTTAPETPSSEWIAIQTTRVNLAAIPLIRISPDGIRTTLSIPASGGGTVTIAEARDTTITGTVQAYVNAHQNEFLPARVDEAAGSDAIYIRRNTILRVEPTTGGHWSVIVNPTATIAGYIDSPP